MGNADAGIMTDALNSELKQLRTMGKALISNLEEGARNLEGRMGQVMVALSGDAGSSAGQSAKTAGRAAQSTSEAPASAATIGDSETKKKRNKKKGRPSTGGGAAGNAE